jgi:hypothetical protein
MLVYAISVLLGLADQTTSAKTPLSICQCLLPNVMHLSGGTLRIPCKLLLDSSVTLEEGQLEHFISLKQPTD